MLNDVIFAPAESQKINSAGSILIVGGGPTGVELAGEIAFDFPDKKVTLVHSGSRLLEFIGTKASDKTLHWLKSKKVEVKLEQRVNLDSVSDERKTYQTSAGEIINADCHFLCIGTPLGSAWLMETMLKNNIDTHGRLMVDENLRVKGRKNIFAIGDITDIPVSAICHTVIIWLCLVFVMGLSFHNSSCSELKLIVWPHT
jgi:NADH dehydrogenase FAD-containing subunit